MDRSNKYYSIIENLVRNHRKFPGLEAILEDIIDDIYKHAESVIESIDDEMVIDGYLQKIVSTSIITVPKKLNFHNEIRHRYIPSEYTPIVASTNISAPAQVKEENEKQEENIAEKTEINGLENNISEDLPQDKNEKELIIDNEDTEDLTEFIETNDISELEQEQEQERPDNSLVDKMINSITEDTLKDEGISQKEEDADEDNLLEEIADVQSDELNTDIINADEIEEDTTDMEELVSYSDVSNVENLSDLQVEDSITDEQEEIILEDNSSEEIADKEEPEEEEISTASEEENIILDEESNIFLDEDDETEELKVDIEDAEQTNFDIIDEDYIEDNLTQEEQEEENNTIDFSQEEGDLLEINNSDDENSLELNDSMSFENSEEDEMLIASEEDVSMYEDENNEIDTLEEDDSISITLDSDDSESDIILDEETEDEVIVNNNDGFKPVDYSAFNFNPENKEIITDNNYVAEKLLQTDQEEPGLNMLKIFDLKYKQNLTIEEISELLNVEKQDIVAALDKMVDLI